MSYKPLAIGFEDFKELITNGYYYVDKTWFIKELLDKRGKANLFTRPRRFGKTLNLSMLKYFFEKTQDGEDNSSLFEGLKIIEAGEKYTREQGQYPVIMLSLKSARQGDFKMAYESLVNDISREYLRHSYVLQSDNITQTNKEKYLNIRDQKAEKIDYEKALAFLSQCLAEYHKKKVIILIDEYDVPLKSAYYEGYYSEMIDFIRPFFEWALKENPYLEFAVIIGYLHISKESIFTGLNNFKINSILSENYGEYFGFTPGEVREMFHFYGIEKNIETAKQWYDGYKFGKAEVYNPWGVVRYADSLLVNLDAYPRPECNSSSSRRIIKDLIYQASSIVRDEVELIINGGTIEKPVHEEIIYEDIHASADNIWNFLLFTGYLKVVSKRMEGETCYVTMTIPNKEIKYIYHNTILNWFRDEIKVKDLTPLYQAMLDGDAETFQKELNTQLQSTISYMDSKESFYHGFLLGILANLDGYKIKSNREAGDGRYDIAILHPDETKAPVVLELKISDTFKEMEAKAQEALEQIEENQYDAELPEDGYTESIRYGIAFFKKKCRVKMERKNLE